MANCPNRDKFCFVCGLFTPANHSSDITDTVDDGFFNCYKKNYVANWFKPTKICSTCRTCLTTWSGNKANQRKPRYVSPVEWLPRTEHDAKSCYFCINIELTIGKRFSFRQSIKYVGVATVLAAIERSDENPLDPGEINSNEEEQQPMDYEDDYQLNEGVGTSAQADDAQLSAVDTSYTFVPNLEEQQILGTPRLFTQSEFLNLASELNLHEKARERMASEFKARNLVTGEFGLPDEKGQLTETKRKSTKKHS